MVLENLVNSDTCGCELNCRWRFVASVWSSLTTNIVFFFSVGCILYNIQHILSRFFSGGDVSPWQPRKLRSKTSPNCFILNSESLFLPLKIGKMAREVTQNFELLSQNPK